MKVSSRNFCVAQKLSSPRYKPSKRLSVTARSPIITGTTGPKTFTKVFGFVPPLFNRTRHAISGRKNSVYCSDMAFKETLYRIESIMPRGRKGFEIIIRKKKKRPDDISTVNITNGPAVVSRFFDSVKVFLQSQWYVNTVVEKSANRCNVMCVCVCVSVVPCGNTQKLSRVFFFFFFTTFRPSYLNNPKMRVEMRNRIRFDSARKVFRPRVNNRPAKIYMTVKTTPFRCPSMNFFQVPFVVPYKTRYSNAHSILQYRNTNC